MQHAKYTAKVSSSSSRDRSVFFEVFSRSAILAKAMFEANFNVLAFDWSGNKHLKKFSTVDLDLTDNASGKHFGRWRKRSS